MKLRDFKRGLKNEYQKSFKSLPKKSLFKLKYAILSLVLLMSLFLVGEHFYCGIYNYYVKAEYKDVYALDITNLLVIDSKDNYEDKLYSVKQLKSSILQRIFHIQRYIPDKGLSGGGNNKNNQHSGISGADIAKIDENYIYSIAKNELYIYALDGTLLTHAEVAKGDLLYVYEDKIVIIGKNGVEVFSFDNNILIKENSFTFERYIDSFIVDNKLFIVGGSRFDNNGDYQNIYYDGCSIGNYLYEVISLDLNNGDIKKINSLNAENIYVYISEKHIFLANSTYLRYGVFDANDLTIISIFNLDLSPVGTIRVEGSILDQTAMNENNNYLRIITTDILEDSEKVNAISIYDLKTLRKVGYLNDGIGVEKQVVNSIFFKEDECYVTTYGENHPYIKLDLSDVYKPKIAYKTLDANLLGNLKRFEINGEKYLLNIQLVTDLSAYEIVVYKYTTNGLERVSNEYRISENDIEADLLVEINRKAFEDRYELLVVEDTNGCYFGLKADLNKYYIFKYEVDNQTIKVYKTVEMDEGFKQIRAFKKDNKLILINGNQLLVKDWD